MMPDLTRNDPSFQDPPIFITNEEEDDLTASSTLPELVSKFLSSVNLDVPTTEEIPEIDVQNVRFVGSQNPTLDENPLPDIQIAADSLSVLTLGKQEHDISLNLTLNTSPDINKVWEGFLKGGIHFGTAQLQIEYDLTNTKRLTGKWTEKLGEQLTFQDISNALGISHNIPVEAMGLDLHFSSVAFELQLDEGHFLLSARSVALGDAFFAASNANDTWNFVFGILIPSGEMSNALSNMVGNLISEIGIEEACCIYSTLEEDIFMIPKLPVLPDGTQPSFTFLESMSFKIDRGIVFCADLVMSETNNPLLKTIPNIIKKDRLLLQTPLSPPLTGERFTARFLEPITIEVGESCLVLKQPEILLNLDPMQVQLKGLMDVPLGTKSLSCTTTIEIGETHAQCSVQLNRLGEDGQAQSLPSPLGLPGIHLDDIGVNMGWTFTPPSLQLGLDGTFHLTDQPPGVNQFGITVAFQGSLITPKLFYGYLEQLDLETFYKAVTDKQLTGTPAFLNKLAAKQVFMYWSQITKELPDGTLISEGVGFNGFIDLFGFKTHASLIISRGGIQGSALAAPYRLGNFLTIGGKGEGIRLKEYLVNGNWTSLKKEPKEKYECRMNTYISPGGAVLQFNTVTSPYLYASARISFFHLVDQEVEIEISDQGFRFEVETDIGGLMNTKWICQLNDQTFSAEAKFKLDLDIEVGPIKIQGMDLGSFGLDVEFNASAKISGSLTEWSLSLEGDFMFEGARIPVPSFPVKADTNVLFDLPGYLADKIKDAVKDAIQQFPSANEVLQKAKEAVEQAINKAGENAQAFIDNATAEANKIKKEAEQVGQAIGAGVENAIAKADELRKEAEEILEKGNDAINNIKQDAINKAEELKKQVEAFPGKAKAEIDKIAEKAQKETDRILQQGEDLVINAGEQASKLLADANAEFNRINEEVVKKVEEILNDAKKYAKELEDKAAEVWKDIEEWAKETEEKARKFSPGKEIERVFKRKVSL